MADEKMLVVYYSRTGNTRKLAEAIAAELQCDMEEIVDRKDRGGFLGYMGSGKDALFKKEADLETDRHDPAEYDLVIIGTPVWAWSVSVPVRTWIERHAEGLPEVAFFLTTGGTGIDGTFEAMEDLCGKGPRAVLGLKAKALQKNEHIGAAREFVAELI